MDLLDWAITKYFGHSHDGNLSNLLTLPQLCRPKRVDMALGTEYGVSIRTTRGTSENCGNIIGETFGKTYGI
jgi:hypothetical protein